LQLSEGNFPYINTLKSHVGHCLSAAGSVESVASVLQIKHQLVFPNLNCEDLNPEIATLIPIEKIPQKIIQTPVNIVMKASFGFGDVNAAVVFKKY
jgi:3-oxoacyl-(acyl-carrier-protein) synthase